LRVENSRTPAHVGSRSSFCRPPLRLIFLHQDWVDFFGVGDKFSFRCRFSFFVKEPWLGELRSSVFLSIALIFRIFTKSPVLVWRVVWFSVSCWIAYLLGALTQSEFPDPGSQNFSTFRRPKLPHIDWVSHSFSAVCYPNCVFLFPWKGLFCEDSSVRISLVSWESSLSSLLSVSRPVELDQRPERTRANLSPLPEPQLQQNRRVNPLRTPKDDPERFRSDRSVWNSNPPEQSLHFVRVQVRVISVCRGRSSFAGR
jgi:hypothetical protein